MSVDLPQTSSKIDGPLVKQFSIFLPNKVGAMLDVVKLLHAHSTHVVALSIAESTDSAIARIVVSDPEQVVVTKSAGHGLLTRARSSGPPSALTSSVAPASTSRTTGRGS